MRSIERKKSLGEVWTPLPLVWDVLKKLPNDVWLDASKTFLDNSCGHGNFLIGVLSFKLINGGHAALQALSTIYGVDIMEDNILEARERLLVQAEKLTKTSRTPEWVEAVNKNIIVGDGLKPETWSFNK